MPNARNPCGDCARSCAARRRVDIDQDFRAANTFDCAQNAFRIIFNRCGDIWIIRRKCELHLNVAIIDLD